MEKLTINKGERLPTKCPTCGCSVCLSEGGYIRTWVVHATQEPTTVLDHGFSDDGDLQYELHCTKGHAFSLVAGEGMELEDAWRWDF